MIVGFKVSRKLQSQPPKVKNILINKNLNVGKQKANKGQKEAHDVINVLEYF